MSENDEILYLMFLMSVYYIDVDCDKISGGNTAEFIELPKCPLCIEKIDGSITYLHIDVIKENRVYSKKNR